MRKIKVLMADDAIVVRKIITDILSQDEELEVIATANGKILLDRLPQVEPDIVLLDVEMPEMNGLETLERIRKTHRLLPIIMFSTLTKRGAQATLEALYLGATDYVTKPANVGSVTAAMETLRETLIPKIKAFTRRNVIRASSPSTPTASLAPKSFSQLASSTEPAIVDLVVIASSTGGPEGLAAIFPRLPESFPVPILVVQHMPPLFTRLLAERLHSLSAVSVSEASSGDLLRCGSALIAPGNFHMDIESCKGQLQARVFVGAPENSCRPAADVLFRSAAQHFGNRVLGVVLTGMGQDGMLGSQAIVQAGGRIVIQDEATSVVWGMPGAVAQAGLADTILPLDQIASEIVRRVSMRRPLPKSPPFRFTSLAAKGLK